jgi:hypothetical protein
MKKNIAIIFSACVSFHAFCMDKKPTIIGYDCFNQGYELEDDSPLYCVSITQQDIAYEKARAVDREGVKTLITLNKILNDSLRLGGAIRSFLDSCISDEAMDFLLSNNGEHFEDECSWRGLSWLVTSIKRLRCPRYALFASLLEFQYDNQDHVNLLNEGIIDSITTQDTKTFSAILDHLYLDSPQNIMPLLTYATAQKIDEYQSSVDRQRCAYLCNRYSQINNAHEITLKLLLQELRKNYTDTIVKITNLKHSAAISKQEIQKECNDFISNYTKNNNALRHILPRSYTMKLNDSCIIHDIQEANENRAIQDRIEAISLLLENNKSYLEKHVLCFSPEEYME